jgi:hypothetical protein
MNPNDATASAFCSTLHDDLLPWAFVFTVAGFIWSFKDILTSPFAKPQKAMILLVEVCIIAALLAGWKALYFTWLESTVGSLATQAGETNQFIFISQVMVKSGQASQSFFTFDWSRVLYLAVAYGFLKAVTYFAMAVQWVMEVFRVFFINCMYALSPLFVPMIIFRPLSSTGSRFILTATTLHFWKIGFVLVDVGSYAMFENAETGTSNAVDAVATIFPIFLASGWIIIGYLGTPFAIRAITQVGSSFAGAMMEGGSSLVSGSGVVRAGANTLSNAGSSMAGFFVERSTSTTSTPGPAQGSTSTPPATTSAPSSGTGTVVATPAQSLAGSGTGTTAQATGTGASAGAAQAAIARTQAQIDEMMMKPSAQTSASNPGSSPSSSVVQPQATNDQLSNPTTSS